jgi:hypothetical protein
LNGPPLMRIRWKLIGNAVDQSPTGATVCYLPEGYRTKAINGKT